tara:strand:- start:1062 stop:1307 length:246 start_codon:yes stop_codon:yes gene_type:complete
MALPTEKQFYVKNGPVLVSGTAFRKALEKKEISKESFEFHIKNGDFTKWVEEVLLEPLLAKKISKLKSQSGILKKIKEHIK